MKLTTPVVFDCPHDVFSYEDAIVFLGSCFASSVGNGMKEAGFDVMVNPFGPLYNPLSISNAASRLQSGIPFTGDDCVPLGAGADKICSFSHHTSFARASAEAFLENANASLSEASEFWHKATVVVVTLGTSLCWQRIDTGETVTNCLKRPASEFVRKALDTATTAVILKAIVARYPEKKFIFTVSPVRHFGDGAHANQLSKSVLLLASDEAVRSSGGRALYFPSYEIMMDELRDYRFYDPGMTHPTAQAADYIKERFLDWGLPLSERETLEIKKKEFLRSKHRNILEED